MIIYQLGSNRQCYHSFYVIKHITLNGCILIKVKAKTSTELTTTTSTITTPIYTYPHIH
jgi:hypothetical protein